MSCTPIIHNEETLVQMVSCEGTETYFKILFNVLLTLIYNYPFTCLLLSYVVLENLLTYVLSYMSRRTVGKCMLDRNWLDCNSTIVLYMWSDSDIVYFSSFSVPWICQCVEPCSTFISSRLLYLAANYFSSKSQVKWSCVSSAKGLGSVVYHVCHLYFSHSSCESKAMLENNWFLWHFLLWHVTVSHLFLANQ